MEIDSQTQFFLEQINAEGNPQLHELPVEMARTGLKEMTLAMDAPESEVQERREVMIPGPAGDIPARIYWPEASNKETKLPVLLLYHGGGFALGDLDTHENMSRYYCQHAEVIVINVDYRLSPENKFPAGVEDCYAALCWTTANAGKLNADSDRIAVTGDSAGGNLSAVICQLSKSRKGPKIAYQVLAYPCVTMDMDADYLSREEFGEASYLLSKSDMNWLNGMYFENPDVDTKDLRSSPILADDLTGLPPALIITAGYDVLRDEGKHYADRLQAAGVDVEYVCFETTIHGFMSFSGALDVGKEALALVSRTLREKL
jgi:acetyl esterase/lipase